MRAFALAACAVLIAAAGACASSEPVVEVPPAQARPALWSDQSYYLPMRDGVRIALSLYFPEGRPPAEPAPIILVQTRYGRAGQMRYGESRMWREAGYVLAVVDTRGSTASFGARPVEMGADELRDMDEIIAHLAAQPWSNGQVIAEGVSYMADTADFATSRPAPALIGAIPRQVDFDGYAHLIAPGGVINDQMLLVWGGRTYEYDVGRWERNGRAFDCVARAEDCADMFPVLQPVDGDEDFTLLRAALRDRQRWRPEDYLGIVFRDDAGANGYSTGVSSPAMQLDGVRRERKPVMYWGSWVDAGTSEAALARFRSAPGVPMEVWITANNHGGDVGGDPFLAPQAAPQPSEEAQFASMRDFAERLRRGETIERVVNYYVLGAQEFRRTHVWPPAGVAERLFYLSDGGVLTERPGRNSVARYDVDLEATTGTNTRWSTQLGAPPAYPDRAAADRTLLVYDSAPMPQDMEIAGAPVIMLYVSAETDDPAFFIYLEDVAPDGRVTYLTEGMLRAIHRRPADPAALPYDPGPAPHSFLRSDAMAVVPGEVMEVRFALFSTAALVRAGHRLRVAIAGADTSLFHVYSHGAPEVFRVRQGGRTPSTITVPMRPWSP